MTKLLRFNWPLLSFLIFLQPFGANKTERGCVSTRKKKHWIAKNHKETTKTLKTVRTRKFNFNKICKQMNIGWWRRTASFWFKWMTSSTFVSERLTILSSRWSSCCISYTHFHFMVALFSCATWLNPRNYGSKHTIFK